MMGYGASSSNLSPLAPPFTVDRSAVAKPGVNPLVDLSEPAYPTSMVRSFQDWSNNPHNYFPLSGSFTIPHPDCDPLLPSSSEYKYLGALSTSSSTVHLPSGGAYYGESTKVPPYYSPYVSRALDDDVSMVKNCSGYELLSNSHVVTSMASSTDSYTPRSGLWGKGLVDWPPAVGDGSFFAKDDYVDRGFYSPKDLHKYKEGSYSAGVAGSHKLTDSANEAQVDCKPALSYSKFYTDLTATPLLSLESASAMPRTYPHIPSSEEFNSRIHEMTYYTPHQQYSLSSETASGDIFCLANSSPATYLEQLQDASRYSDNKSCWDKDRKEVSSHNPPVIWEFHPSMNSEGKVPFDTTKPSFHMEEKGQKTADFLSTKFEELPGRNGASTDGFGIYSGANSASHVSCANLDEFNLNVNEHQVTCSTESYTKNGDHLNPAVDSPCWRGAPVSHMSPFCESSKAFFTQNVAEVEVCDGNSIQGHDNLTQEANDDLKVTIQMESDNTLRYENDVREMPAPSGKGSSVASMLNRDGTDNAVNLELQHSNCSGVYPYIAFQMHNKENTVSDTCVRDSGMEALNVRAQGHKEVSQASEKQLGHKVIDADAALDNKFNLEHFSSVTCKEQQASHSEFSVKDAPCKITEPYCQESMSKIFAAVVDDLHNLSEGLLFHCLDGTCELKEEQCVALKGVISNLNACVLKNVEKLATSKESLIFQNQPASVVGSPSKLHKVTEGNAIGLHGVVEDRLFQKGKDNIVSGSEDAKLSNGIFARSFSDMLNQENSTQAIKKILDENFPVDKELQAESLLYKNLWLEAEASLCSVNYIARYYRQKKEVENLNTQRGAGDRSGSQVSLPDPPEAEVVRANGASGPTTAVTNVNSIDDVMARYSYSTLKLRDSCTNSASSFNKGCLASSGASIDLNEVDKLACGGKDFKKAELFLKDSPLSSATSHAAVDQASVVARFHMVNIGADESTNDLNMGTKEQSLNSPNIPDLNKADQPASVLEDVCKGPDHLSLLCTSSPTDDVESSVMARFQILKRRDGISSPTTKEEHHVDDDDGVVGLRRKQPVDDNVARHRFPNIKLDDYVNAPGNSKVDQSTMEVKDAAAEDPPIINLQSRWFHDVEASQMSRSHVPNCRDGNNSEYVVSRRNRPIEYGVTGAKMKPGMQVPGGSSTGAEGIFKEFYLFAKDDPVTGPRAANQPDQPNAGRTDVFYSDWEHVLKEEFAGQRN